MIEYRFSLELTKNGIQKSIHAKAGEVKGRKLVITLTESGEIYNIGEEFKARVFFEDNTYSDDVKIIDNRIHFELPSGLISKSGVRICEVKLYLKDDTTVIYSPMFEIVAEKSLGSEADAQALRPTVKYQELIANTGIKKSEMNDNDMIVIFDSENGVVMRFAWKDMKDALGGHSHENAATLGALGESDGQLTYNGSAVGEKPTNTVEALGELSATLRTDLAQFDAIAIGAFEGDFLFDKIPIGAEIKSIEFRLEGSTEWIDIKSMFEYDGIPHVINMNHAVWGYDYAMFDKMFALITFSINGTTNFLYDAAVRGNNGDIRITYYTDNVGGEDNA